MCHETDVFFFPVRLQMSDSSRATKNTMAKWSCAERIPVTVIIDNYQESPFALRRDCDVWTKYLK